MNPDRWMILAVDDGESPPFKKVFATWAGGYTTGDSWRLNSGIDKVQEAEDYYLIESASGTPYRLHKQAYGLAGASNAYVLKNLMDKFPNQIKVLDEPEALEWLSGEKSS